ncbi:MAG: CoA-disulfide reductase [Thermoplasmata archaeon]|nr:CoA-disulfide reductase [Thermoplasmata archaeon]
MKAVIVGGVAGGASAAARLRRLDESAEIVMFERTGYVSYANCGLPYYVGGVITDKGKLTLQTPQSFASRFDVDARVLSDVVSVDRAAKKVHVRNLADGSEYDESYDYLILSPGARAMRPDIEGMDDPRVMTMRTVEDTFAMRSFIEDRSPRTAVVCGGGFIGLEVAENLCGMGIKVTVVQRPDHVLPTLDRDMAADLHHCIRSHGIDLLLGESLEGLDTSGELKVRLKSGRVLEADMAVIALGVVPDTVIAKDAGLELGIKGAIVTDSHMRTSDPSIYAVGDAVQVRNFVSGLEASIALAGPANRQGRIAADNIAGLDSEYKGSMGSSVIKVFEMTAASTGLTEKAARAAGVPYEKVYTYSASHASYYPGARNMQVKVLFDPASGRIVGAQIVGYEGVDKRIDVIATAIYAGLSVEDLAQLDLAYAPPYSSAKDPVNYAGFVACNVMSGRLRQFYWDQLPSKLSDPAVTVLDVRTSKEYAQSHLEGVLHIPVDDLRARMAEIPKGKPVYAICHSGLRSYIACMMLSQEGYECYNLAGGYRFYSSVARDMPVGSPTDYPCGVSNN